MSQKFSTLEFGVLEPNRLDFWNQHSRISLETNFQDNQNKLRVCGFFEKIPFLGKIPLFDKNFKIESPFVKASSISSRLVVLSSKSDNCSKSR